jgi:CBS domain containing-hemolysin-like protein
MQNLIKQHFHSANEQLDLRLILNPTPAVPEDTLVEDLLSVFKRKRIHMAVVLDEFGGMSGVVTLEDLVEEVVGEVRDEFDVEKEPLVEVEPGVLELAGNYLVDDLLDQVYLGTKEELPDVDTVGGLIITELGRPPQVNDEVTYGDNVDFKVLSVDGRAVSRVRVTFPTLSDEDEDSADEEH